MANEPGETEGNKPGGDNKPAGGPTTPAPGSPPAPGSGRGPYLIITPSPASVLRQAEEPGPEAGPEPTQAAAPEPPQESPQEPSEEPAPLRLVDPPPQPPAEKPTAPRSKPPSLSARSTDRLATMPPPPRRRGGGCLILLLVLALITGGGYLLWRGGRLDPLIAWAQPYTDKLAPIADKIRPIIAKIEALIPGHQEPAAESGDAMILETKQLLLKLDFQPGPMNGLLDPATVAAIEAYQEAAGLPVDGQPSQALLDDLRSVANPSSN